MKNKGLIYFLTITISFLSIYYLQFTFVSQRIQGEATETSRDSEGNIDFKKKQKYLDSIWNKPVYNLVSDFTFKDIKESELNLGLDLQGGMHVTLEVSPVDILVGLSSNSQDPDFLQAISQARENIKGTQLDFISEFYSEFNTIAPQKNLAQIFATVSNRGRIGFDSSDSEILDIINEEVESAIDRSFNILRTRIDRFGTSQPNIQRLQGTGRIQIELPGVDNPERVRKLLQGVAKLEFWEVSELNETEVSQTIQIIDQFAVSQNILNNNLSEENTEIDNTSQSDDIESSWRSFKAEFELIIAAGGLVKKHQDYLFIYRNGKWDLPKGKLENNEDFAECAVREVEEECGIKDLALEHKLIETYHTYLMNGKMVLKETHWYLMNSTYSGAFIPQREEGIEKVEWRSKNDIPELMKDSFSSIKKVIDSERN